MMIPLNNDTYVYQEDAVKR